MAKLDVSEIVVDPDFADQLMINRRTEAVDSHGRTVTGTSIVTPRPWGVVLHVEGSSLERGPDEQHMPHQVEVHTKFRLRSATPDHQPDILIWGGNNWVVVEIDDYSNFGAGFVRAVCESMDAIDEPPEESSEEVC